MTLSNTNPSLSNSPSRAAQTHWRERIEIFLDC